MIGRGLVLSLALILLAGCGRGLPVPSNGPLPRLALRLEKEGLYQIEAPDLAPFGWDLAALADEDIRLSRGDEPVPFLLAGEGRERSLRFYGNIRPTRFYEHAVYYLELTGGSPPLAELSAAPGAGEPATAGEDRREVQGATHYLAQVRDGNPWLGERIFAPGELSLSFSLAPPAPGPARITLTVWGATSAPVDPDHHLLITLNGQVIGDEAWDGDGWHTISLSPPVELLRAGANNLLLAAAGDTGARAELVYFDTLTVDYLRLLQTTTARLNFRSRQTALHLWGWPDEAVEVWEVSDPLRPLRLRDFSVAAQGDGYGVELALPPDGERRYVAASAAGYLRPAAVAPAPAPLLPPPEGADYIAIVHPDLAAALDPLLAHRQSQGLRTVSVTTEQIYQRFSGGLPDPAALNAFLRWAATSWAGPAPRFLLLAGDASYDVLDRLDGPYKNKVPTGLVDTVEMGETASDNALADLDGDGLPDLAVGRLPAQTPQQLDAMVDKTLDYERQRPQGNWQQDVLFVADDDDAYFNSFNELMSAALPPKFNSRQLLIGQEADVHGELVQALDAGQRLVSYMGHGAVDIWAQEEIFSNDDVATLEQQGRLPFIVVWACLSGYFHHPQLQSLGETLLLAPDKGAVAALVPTGQTYPYDQQVMADALFHDRLFSAETVGEALQASFRQLNPASPGQRDIINTFVLLGDPALHLFDGEG